MKKIIREGNDYKLVEVKEDEEFQLNEEANLKQYLGVKFIPRGKGKTVYTVIDIYTIKNMKGKIIRSYLVAEHMLMGQVMVGEIPVASIVRGTIQ